MADEQGEEAGALRPAGDLWREFVKAGARGGDGEGGLHGAIMEGW